MTDQKPDAVIIEYWDPIEDGLAMVQYPPAFLPTNPLRLRNDAVTTRAAAERHAQFEYMHRNR